MAKNQKQKLHDDLNALLDKYPNMLASDALLTVQSWMDGVWRALPKPGKGRGKRVLIRERRCNYRLM